MTLDSSDTIDLVTASSDGSTLFLIAVATEEFRHDNGQLEKLDKKLHFYHELITSGSFDEQYPDHENTAKVIRLDHYVPITDDAEQILKTWATTLSAANIGLCSSQSSFNPIKFLSRLFKRSEDIRRWTS